MNTAPLPKKARLKKEKKAGSKAALPGKSKGALPACGGGCMGIDKSMVGRIVSECLLMALVIDENPGWVTFKEAPHKSGAGRLAANYLRDLAADLCRALKQRTASARAALGREAGSIELSRDLLEKIVAFWPLLSSEHGGALKNQKLGQLESPMT